jgi:hypothetical protein
MESSPGGWLTAEALAAVAETWKMQGRNLTARFGGSSMEPTLPAGVELSFACGTRVEVGDIAVLLNRGKVVVHRVVARCEPLRLVLTRGDGTWVPDPPTGEDQVVGRVVQVRRGDDWIAPPSGPSSAWRRLVVRACLKGLGTSETWGRRLIAGLWYGRYGLQLVPAALLLRLRRGGPPTRKEDEHARSGKPERQ